MCSVKTFKCNYYSKGQVGKQFPRKYGPGKSQYDALPERAVKPIPCAASDRFSTACEEYVQLASDDSCHSDGNPRIDVRLAWIRPRRNPVRPKRARCGDDWVRARHQGHRRPESPRRLTHSHPALARRGPLTTIAAASGSRLPNSSRSRLGPLWIFGPGKGARRQATANGLAPRSIPSGRRRATQGQRPGQCRPQRVRFPPEEPWLPGSGLQTAPPP